VEPLALFEIIGQVTILAVLRHDIHVVAGLIYIEQLNNVIVLHLLHYLDFEMDVLQVEGIGEDLLIDNFNSDGFTAVYSAAKIYCSVGTLPNY
jgi:hypothetical protein